MTGLGPFEVGPDQIERVGGGFTTLINQLLTLESRRARMLRHQVLVDYQPPVRDGGVDAHLEATYGTDWLPDGVSAWQFKSGDLPPSKCKTELRGAAWAQELLKAGATYTLVLGQALTAQKVVARKKALQAEAAALNLPANPERYRVYDANKLAEWVTEFPGLAVHQLLGGHAAGAYNFEYWSSSQRHQTVWTTSPDRDAEIAQILADLDVGKPVGLRISGVSGLGKTRLVMEAVRDTSWEPMVAYVPAIDEMPSALLAHAVDPHRAVLLVVDECTARQHEKLVERVPLSSTVRIITIGQDPATPLSAPILQPAPMPPEAMDAFLASNQPTLSTEARQFVIAHADGNVRFALLIAERLETEPEASAAELIRRDDISAITGALLPEGQGFFVAAVLALFERVGWDRELQTDKDLLAAFAGVTTADLDVIAADLDDRGLLIRQGRYRAVGPHPVAVLLAAQAWRQHGDRIVTELLPQLTEELTLALLTRVSDLGSYPPARDGLRQLLTSESLTSLEAVEESGVGGILTRLAVVMPDELSDHLHRLLADTRLEMLQQQVRTRRELVWTLEKLVWHSRLFEQAADSILRLALAENERYANNATGLWTSLFAAVLPPTAAAPEKRLAYLRRVGGSTDRASRRIAVSAAQEALHPHESVIVSGELQGGSLVEPRGGVTTPQEAEEYRAALVTFLAAQYRASEHDPEFASQTATALIGALHPLIDQPVAGAALRAALVALRPADLPALRTSIENLRSLFRDDPSPTVEAGLNAVEAGLPPVTTLERVRMLTDLDPWTFQDDQRADELRAALQQLHTSELDAVLGWLTDRAVNGGWHLGFALATVAPGDTTVTALLRGAGQNLTAVAGYLAGRLDAGDTAAVSSFFDSPEAKQLPTPDLLSLAVRLPATPENLHRVLALLDQVSAHDGSRRLFGWQREFNAEQVADLLARWLPRIADQDDYNAVVDWLAGWFHRRTDLPAVLAAGVRELVLSRAVYPDLGQQASDWTRLSSLIAGQAVPDLAMQVFDLVAKGLSLHPSTPEARLLVHLAATDPEVLWQLVGEQLEQDNWRLSMSIRGWLANSVPIEMLSRWVAGDVKRARLLAHVASAGDETPSPAALYLLTEFGSDDAVRSGLAADFVSGGWTGLWSARIRHQLDILRGWDRPDAPDGVRSWAREMRRQLDAELVATLEREAERGY